MKDFSKIQMKIIVERLWKNIDRIFATDVKSFLESMSVSDRTNYFLNKRQLVHNVLNWWKTENFKPLYFSPEKAIHRTKEQVYCGLVENLDVKSNFKEDLLVHAMLNMIVVPNILQITENSDVKSRFKKSETFIKYIRMSIKDCVDSAIKYSDLEK